MGKVAFFFFILIMVLLWLIMVKFDIISVMIFSKLLHVIVRAIVSTIYVFVIYVFPTNAVDYMVLWK